MVSLPFALYDSFSESAFGGSQAAIVSNAAHLDDEMRRRIVREMGLPAIGFVSAANRDVITARFQSTQMELPMCGHGTIGLISRMVEEGILDWDGGKSIDVELHLPAGPAAVTVTRRDDGRPFVMLEVRKPTFRTDDLDRAQLAALLAIDTSDFSADWPIETALADFVHLIVPVRGLEAMRRIAPDFVGLVRFCRDRGIETLVTFSTEVERPESTVHVRDFCPAVGVAESAAAGTTNAALTGYLIRHAVVRPNGDGQVHVQAEQGCEIERPSSISTRAVMAGEAIVRLQVGGVATKVADGLIHLS